MVQNYEKRIHVRGLPDGIAAFSFDSPAGAGYTALVTWQLSLADQPGMFLWGYPDDLLSNDASNMTPDPRVLFHKHDDDLKNQAHYDEVKEYVRSVIDKEIFENKLRDLAQFDLLDYVVYQRNDSRETIC